VQGRALGIELVGSVPAEVQDILVFIAGISTAAANAAAARSLIDSLKTPAAAAIIAGQGLDTA
jgi:molybdate transport system substrate-binding protein